MIGIELELGLELGMGLRLSLCVVSIILIVFGVGNSVFPKSVNRINVLRNSDHEPFKYTGEYTE